MSRTLYARAGVSPVSAAGTGLTLVTWHLGPVTSARRVAMDPTMRVLVVEDFEVLARPIGTGLRREGMAVDVVLDGSDALDHLAVTRYDVVVLDRDLPGVHGDEVCRRLVAGRSGQPGPDADRGQHGHRTGWTASAWAPTTTCPSRLTSPSWWPGPGPRTPLRPALPPTLRVR